MNNEWQDWWADRNFLQEMDSKRRHPRTLAEKVASNKEYLSKLITEGPDKFEEELAKYSQFIRNLSPEERRARWERECLCVRASIRFDEKVIARETAAREVSHA